MREAQPNVSDAPPARVSRDHHFSLEQLAEAVTVVSSENRSKRLLMTVTTGHRSLALRQVIISSVLGALTMVCLYVLELVHPTMDRAALHMWAFGTSAYIVVRVFLTALTFAPTPAQMARSTLLRTVPLAVVFLTAVQWIWCINVFIGQELTLHVFIIFAGLLGISVAVIGMWPTVPSAAVLFMATTWPPFFYRLFQLGWVPPPVLFIVVVSVALVVFTSVYLEVKQLRPILNRSDAVDVLLGKLNAANTELTTANGRLDDMRQAAAAELESRSIFFASASHDFRQRLHAVKLLSRSAVHDAGTSTSGGAPLVRLAEAVEDVDQYVTQILNFAQLEASALEPLRIEVDLQRVFQQLELSFEEVVSAADVKLSVRVTDLVLHTDAAMLQRICENLLSNAIKYSKGRRVLVAARRRKGGVAIEVWDQGTGIPKESLSSIFTPFVQLSSRTSSFGGIGLGLAVVKRFVDSLGYSISVRSRAGRGTVVIVLVPPVDIKKASNDGG